jgi:hypothetical protein
MPMPYAPQITENMNGDVNPMKLNNYTLTTIYPITRMMQGFTIDRKLEFLECYEQELTSTYGLSIDILESIVLGKTHDETQNIKIRV